MNFFLLNQNYYYHSIFEIQIPVLHGCIVEGVATLLCRLTSKFLSDKEPQYSAAIDSFVATSLVVAGIWELNNRFTILINNIKDLRSVTNALRNQIIIQVSIIPAVIITQFLPLDWKWDAEDTHTSNLALFTGLQHLLVQLLQFMSIQFSRIVLESKPKQNNENADNNAKKLITLFHSLLINILITDECIHIIKDVLKLDMVNLIKPYLYEKHNWRYANCMVSVYENT